MYDMVNSLVKYYKNGNALQVFLIRYINLSGVFRRVFRKFWVCKEISEQLIVFLNLISTI